MTLRIRIQILEYDNINKYDEAAADPAHGSDQDGKHTRQTVASPRSYCFYSHLTNKHDKHINMFGFR